MIRDSRLGQVYTPAPVADLTLALALERGARGARVLDPACGDGVFLARAIAAGVAPRDAYGIDVDPDAAAAARARVPGARVARGDFLALAPPAVGEWDAVVGNPPYVRQELLGAARKQHIVDRLRDDWPTLSPSAAQRFAGRADLATAFVARSLRFVRPGGRVAMVVSAALLDAAYGDALAPLLGAEARLVAVVASPRERWFSDAAVHGVIVVIQRAEDASTARAAAPNDAPPPRFARLSIPIARAAERVRSLEDLSDVARVRTGPATPPEPGGWGALLRAPDEWFRIAAAAGDAFAPLGTIAPIWRGATSGANDFFYLTRAQAAAARIERRFLTPLFKTPRQAASIRVSARSLSTVAFVCDLDSDRLVAWPGARAWVRRHAHLASRPTLAARPRWWSLSTRPARLLFTKAYASRFAQHLATAPVVPDQRVYGVGAPPELTISLAASLNGTLAALAIESLGRASMGEGVLEWPVGDALALPILDPRRVDRAAVERAFARIATRPIRPVFDEVEAPDRRALDEALAASWPSLRELYPAAREALCRTVSDRLARVSPAPDPTEPIMIESNDSIETATPRGTGRSRRASRR